MEHLGILGKGRFGDKTGENLRVWVIPPTRTGAAAIAFPGTLMLRRDGVSSQPGTIHHPPSSLCVFLERESGTSLADGPVAVAMRGSLSTARTG